MQSGLKPYPDSAARRVGKAEKRTSADYPVVQYPVQGAACHLRLSFGQVAGGEMCFSFASMRFQPIAQIRRSEEHTSELQSLMRISYAVFCLKKKKKP